MGRIEICEAPHHIGDQPSRRRAFRLVYRAENASEQSTNGHWDRLLLHDGDRGVVFENWFQQPKLAPGGTYEGTFDVQGLDEGEYKVSLTLDGGGDDPNVVLSVMTVDDPPQ